MLLRCYCAERSMKDHDEIHYLASRNCNASIHCQSDSQGQRYSSFPAHFIIRQANQNVEIFALKSDTFDTWHLFSSPSTTWHPFAFLSSTLPICQLWPRRIQEHVLLLWDIFLKATATCFNNITISQSRSKRRAKNVANLKWKSHHRLSSRLGKSNNERDDSNGLEHYKCSK